MKVRRYEALKRELKIKDIDQKYLADKLGRCPAYVSSRLLGKAPWTMEEMYKIMELINRPAEELYIIFPKDGITPKAKPLPAGNAIKCVQIDNKLYQIMEVAE